MVRLEWWKKKSHRVHHFHHLWEEPLNEKRSWKARISQTSWCLIRPTQIQPHPQKKSGIWLRQATRIQNANLHPHHLRRVHVHIRWIVCCQNKEPFLLVCFNSFNRGLGEAGILYLKFWCMCFCPFLHWPATILKYNHDNAVYRVNYSLCMIYSTNIVVKSVI